MDNSWLVGWELVLNMLQYMLLPLRDEHSGSSGLGIDVPFWGFVKHITKTAISVGYPYISLHEFLVMFKT